MRDPFFAKGIAMSDYNYWTNARRRRISRRTMLGASAKAGVGAAGLALVGCGGDDDDDDGAAAPAAAAVEEQAEQAEAQAEEQAMDEEEEPAVAAGQPRRGGTLRRSIADNLFTGWDPHTAATGLDNLGYINHVFDRMLGFEDDGAVAGMLAESVENPDNVTYIFNMRPGVVFHDGAPVDAPAVQANMERLQGLVDVGGGSRNSEGIKRAVSLEAVDDLAWRMVNSEPFGPTLVSFQSFPGTGMLISPDKFDEALTDPVGAGHLKFGSYTEGEAFVGERWDDYWDNDNVWLDGMNLRIIPDANTSWNAFLNGDLDTGGPPGGITLDLKQELEADGFNVITGSHQVWTQTWYNMNPNSEEGFNVFRDPRMRRAVHLIMDRQAITDVAHQGLGKPSRGPTSVESWSLPAGVDYYSDSPNLGEAQSLMDAAGFGDGIKGVQLAYSPEYQRIITEPAHAQWAAAGIDLDYVHGQEPPIIDRLLAVQDWTIATLSWESPFDPDPVLRQSLEGMQNWMYGTPADGARTGRADVSLNPSDDVLVGLAETEDLLNKAAAPATQAERIPLYADMYEVFQEHGWNHHIVQWPTGAAGQGYVGGMRLVPFFGFDQGMGFKYHWFDNV